jgi:hypothetical protein
MAISVAGTHQQQEQQQQQQQQQPQHQAAVTPPLPQQHQQAVAIPPPTELQLAMKHEAAAAADAAVQGVPHAAAGVQQQALISLQPLPPPQPDIAESTPAASQPQPAAEDAAATAATMASPRCNSSSSSSLADVPGEVMQLLLGRLSAADLARLATCCKGLRSVTWEAVPGLKLVLYPHQASVDRVQFVI